MESEFTCKRCGLTKPINHDGGTGYGENEQGEKTCYICIAELDRQTLIETGNSRNLPLYLTDKGVANWPSTLQFQPFYRTRGRHNMAGTREDVWFNGPDGHIWHGTVFGEWTQILHAKRTKQLIGSIIHC